MLVWLGSALGAMGVGVLRRAWALPVRSPMMNGGGWALMLAGLVLGASGAGAWGVAIAAQVAMVTACLFLAHAAIVSRRPKRAAADRETPSAKAPLRLGGRLLTFLLTVPLALAVSLLIGVAARGLAGLAGWPDADGNVLALLILPLAWAVLATALLMSEKRRTQGLVLLLPALAGGVLLLAGGSA